jgi:hypothetical protein
MEGGEGRRCSGGSAAAELRAALSVEEVRSAHFQGAGQRARGRSSSAAATRVPRPGRASFQALSVIELAALGRETPCLLLAMLEGRRARASRAAGVQAQELGRRWRQISRDSRRPQACV